MKIINGTRYENNYARAAAYYIGTCAPEPVDKDYLAGYTFIQSIYRTIYEDASSVGIKTVPDTPFEQWEQQKGREKDVKAIREPIKKIEALIMELYELIDKGTIDNDNITLPSDKKLSNLLGSILSKLNCKIAKSTPVVITMPDKVAYSLKKYSQDKTYLYFSRCVDNPSDNWIAKAFDTLLKADGKLIWLCNELEKNGYERIDCRDGKKISLDYVRFHGKKPTPVKMSWADKFHSGIELSYEELRLDPAYIWMRIPSFAEVLQNIEFLPEDVVNFIANNTKTCDGCRYCVQTDKTHTRPLASIKVHEVPKCPHFVAFSMNWRSLNKELAENILNTNIAVDKQLG